MRDIFEMMAKILFWSAVFAVGLLLAIPAAIYTAWTGDPLDLAANNLSGMEG